MKQVSQDEFFKEIVKTNCHPTAIGRYPYTSIFRTTSGNEIGRIVNEMPDGQAFPVSRYLLVSNQ